MTSRSLQHECPAAKIVFRKAFTKGVFPMADPVIAQKSPYAVEVEASKSYYWCACGRSANQPFCDGSHKGTEFTPVKYEATESKTVYFCGCKHTAGPPLCDGGHHKL
jgi:CDGSH-type Zn-finger protein